MKFDRRHWIAAAAGTVALALAPLAAHAQGRRPSTATEAAAPLPKDEPERTALGVLDDIDRRQRYLNVGREDGRLLRLLAETTDAKHVVEIGTSTGYSGIWLALGLRATQGRLTTFEIDAERAALAQANFKRAGLDDRITLIRGDAHVEARKLQGPIDIVFIDADKEGYPHYLQTLAPLVRPGGLIVADNMQRPAPDPRYVQAVTTDPAFETVFLNMHASGLGVTLKKH
jgi:predicted O-methyltransferase YrrM